MTDMTRLTKYTDPVDGESFLIDESNGAKRLEYLLREVSGFINRLAKKNNDAPLKVPLRIQHTTFRYVEDAKDALFKEIIRILSNKPLTHTRTIYDLSFTESKAQKIRSTVRQYCESRISKTELQNFIDGLYECFENIEPLDPDSKTKENLTREDIFLKANELKTDHGMSVKDMFCDIETWLLEDLGFTREEVKERFDIGLYDPYSFNRLVTRHI